MEFCRIANDVRLGRDVVIHAFVNLYGCTIGNNSRIGTFVEIQKNASVGENCKISSHSFICEGVEIGNNVFVGHNVTFINDLYPRAITVEGELQDDSNWQLVTTKIADNVSIGSSVTILCGVTIGSSAMIGAASMVLQDIPPHELWAGNPARFIRKIS